MTTNTKQLPDGVRFLRTFEDASGAEALVDVRVNGQLFTFSCNLLGEIKINLISPMSGSRWCSRQAAIRARDLYTAALLTVSDEYIERNRQLYA